MSILQEPIQNAIARLRKQHNDDGDYEAKSCQRSLSKDVWESISAFANTHGGTLLLGLDEHNGFTCVQDFHLDRVWDQLIEGMGDGGRDGIRLSNPPKYDVSRETIINKIRKWGCRTDNCCLHIGLLYFIVLYEGSISQCDNPIFLCHR